MTKRFDNKVVVITGASSGIGKALVYEFARRGAKIVAAARSADQLSAMQHEVNELFKSEVLAVPTDVGIEKDCKNLIEQTIDKFGKIDILINNAGVSMRALFNDLHLDVIRKLMDVNFWGTAYCSKYALPFLLSSKGSLVGVSSIAGYVGLPARSGYSASKSAMQGLLGVIRTENLKQGLHVLIACPGFTASNIRFKALTSDGSQQNETPRNEEKMMSAEKVAKKIADAIVNRKRSLVLTTEGKLSILLNKFIPATVDKLVFKKMSKEINSPFK
ncbi:MAG TPA: SDR family oxidoreductase [Bacteroidales bacterium]|nr:SDR family oxidoreductase [Bacteroidales bacterium]NLH33653.1 SDR family oxidoreductase [Lentimicrobium sp.]MBP7875216.1 SDR family oxidoreductase [Bacteroidales bacterium]MCZ2281547.1 SDR family oxidoreductase [Bacteroidales bacterium]HNY59149.1 SDR family oxidoreductase [Bacteroidales bacterium]